GRRRRRSTQTPAGRLKSAKGRRSTTLRAATSKVDARTTKMAASGRARPVTSDPNWLTLCADQSRRKSRFCQSGPRGRRIRRSLEQLLEAFGVVERADHGEAQPIV